MHRREKSGPNIVAEKSANKAGQLAAESMEPRAGTKGKANPQSALRTQRRLDASHERMRLRPADTGPTDVSDPRWEPYAGIPLVRICAGGAQQ